MQHRETLYRGFGCDTCAATYDEAYPIMASCYAATDEVTCNSGGVPTVTEAASLNQKPGKYGGFRFSEVHADDLANVATVQGVVTSDARGCVRLVASAAWLASTVGLIFVNGGF
jgi:hypothetical protein